MSRPDDSAYPIVYGTNGDLGTDQTSCGLTKREYFAAMAMEAQVTHNIPESIDDVRNIAEGSVVMAEALISALSKRTAEVKPGGERE